MGIRIRKSADISMHDDEGSFALSIPHSPQWVETVLKSFNGITGQLAAINVAIPPHDPFELLTYASRRNGYHSAAIHLKKAMIVGAGYDGDPALLAWLDAIETERGLDELFQSTSGDMETFGYAPIEVRMGAGMNALYRMPAVKTRVVPPAINVKGNPITPVQYVQFYYQARNTGALVNFTPVYFNEFIPNALDGVYMLRLPSISGNYWYGEPEYTSSKDLLATNVSVVDYAKKIFSQGMMADMLIVAKGTNLSRKKRQEMSKYLSANMKGVENAHRIGWLQIGEDEDIQINKLNASIDRSFSELRQDNRDEIIASHLLPPRIVGIISAGSIGGAGEVEGQLKIVKLSLIDGRQKLYEAQWKKLFKMMGAPAWQSFSFKPMDVTTSSNDIAAYARAVQSGMLAPQQALDEMDIQQSGDAPAFSLMKSLRNFRDALQKNDHG